MPSQLGSSIIQVFWNRNWSVFITIWVVICYDERWSSVCCVQLDSATSLIQAAKNLMNAVVLAVKASYVASTKYARAGPAVSIVFSLISTLYYLPRRERARNCVCMFVTVFVCEVMASAVSGTVVGGLA